MRLSHHQQSHRIDNSTVHHYTTNSTTTSITTSGYHCTRWCKAELLRRDSEEDSSLLLSLLPLCGTNTLIATIYLQSPTSTPKQISPVWPLRSPSSSMTASPNVQLSVASVALAAHTDICYVAAGP